ncbi:MAG: hypothetical protein NTV61_00390 [Candidatus Bathyarchaeota archaeon]|nr:hypothetical protein [Candidatus Bathyarchaeota archaeon]
MERGPVTGESLADILGGLLKKTPGHSDPVFRQSLDVGVWSREGKTSDLGASELSRCLAEKLQLTQG